MTKQELEKKVNELRELEQMGKDLQVEIEALKEEMIIKGTEKICTNLCLDIPSQQEDWKMEYNLK